MALVLQDRVKESSSSSGTGSVVLSGAFTGYRTFASCVPNGSVVYYCIHNLSVGSENEWEVGYGTYTLSTTTLSRTSVYSSSNAGSLVDFTAGANGLEVFITYPSEQAVYQETDGSLKIISGVIEVSEDGTEGTTLPNTAYQAFSTVNSYMQTNMQNLSSASQASSDYVATADNGTDTTNFMDMGMASSGYNYPEFSAQNPNSGYIISTGTDLQLVAGKYGADTSGNAADTDIVMFAGSLLNTAERARLKGLTGNFILNNGENPTDTGEKLQVNGTAKITGAATFGSTVTLNADPTAALQAATKQYVDTATSTGIHIHTPCAAETSAALSAVYTQGGTTFNITDITGTNTVVTSTTHGLSVNDQIWLYTSAGNGLSINTPYFVYATPTTTSLQLSTSYGGPLLTGLTNASGLSYATRANSGVGAYLEASANQALPIAGVTTGDRVLVYNQSTGYWNGVYTVTALGSLVAKWKLTRATDADYYSPADTDGMSEGDYFFIQSNSEAYVLTTAGAIIIGYTGITYTLFSSVPIYTGTSPINVSSTVISLNTVPETLGGTNNTSYTTGDTLYASGSNTLAKRNIGSTGQTMIVSGGVPTWGALDMAGSGVSGILPESHGGTNNSTYVTGDTLYASGTNTLGKLGPNTTTTKKFLSQTGTGSAGQAPAWAQPAASDITGLAASATTDTTNASNISSGTLANARTTASSTNGASTIVARDASGNFSANTITANVTGNISGSAATLTTARNFQISGGATAANVSFDGSAAVNLSVTAMNASVINTGTIGNAYTTASSSNGASTIVARDASGNFTAATISATTFSGAHSGDGSALTSLNATALSSGTVASARVSGSYTGITGVGTLTAGTWNASAISDTYLSTISTAGKVSNSATTASSSNGASTIVARDASGNFSAGTITATLNGNASTATSATSATTATTATQVSNSLTCAVSGTGLSGSATFNGSSAQTFTVTSNASSSNGASTLVARDASGNFSAGTITANLTGNASGSAATFTSTTQNSQFNSVGVGTAGSGTAGEIRATNNVTAYYSDERLKTKTGNIENALDKVKQIETMYYHANETAVELGYDASIEEVGVTAQSVQRVMPQTVAPAPIDDKYLTVRYERLVPLLIEAIKELEAQVAELKAK